MDNRPCRACNESGTQYIEVDSQLAAMTCSSCDGRGWVR